MYSHLITIIYQQMTNKPIKIKNIEMIEYSYLLPNQERVQTYLKKIVQDESQNIIEQCYFICPHLKHTYVFLSLIFGGNQLKINLKTLKLQKEASIVDNMQEIIRKSFDWSFDSSPIKIYQTNFNHLKHPKTFKFVCDQFPKIYGNMSQILHHTWMEQRQGGIQKKVPTKVSLKEKINQIKSNINQSQLILPFLNIRQTLLLECSEQKYYTKLNLALIHNFKECEQKQRRYKKENKFKHQYVHVIV